MTNKRNDNHVRFIHEWSVILDRLSNGTPGNNQSFMKEKHLIHLIQKINMENKIKKVLNEIRPHLQMDGGDVKFISFDEKSGILEVKLQGACVGCPMSQITLKEGIGKSVKESVPAVKEVKAI